MLTAPQLILTAHLLNFNWRGTRYSMPDVRCSMVDGSGSSFMRKWYKVSRIRKLECGMRKIRKGAGRMRNKRAKGMEKRADLIEMETPTRGVSYTRFQAKGVVTLGSDYGPAGRAQTIIPTSAFPIPNSKRWLRTRRRIFFGNLLPSYRLRSIHDTDRITYRCFLPDLTRFMTVCCVASNQNGLRVPFVRPLGGNSAPHKRISGKGHR